MEEDDLFVPQRQHQEVSLAGSFGEVFGAMVWIMAIFAIAIGVARILIGWL